MPYLRPITAVALSILTVLAVAPAAAAAELSPAGTARKTVAIKSAFVYANKMPCAPRMHCRNTYVVVMSSKGKCLNSPKAVAVEHVEGVLTVRLKAKRSAKGDSDCSRVKATITVTGEVHTVVDASSGEPVPARVSETH